MIHLYEKLPNAGEQIFYYQTFGFIRQSAFMLMNNIFPYA